MEICSRAGTRYSLGVCGGWGREGVQGLNGLNRGVTVSIGLSPTCGAQVPGPG